jgi:hypothetical protein
MDPVKWLPKGPRSGTKGNTQLDELLGGKRNSWN